MGQEFVINSSVIESKINQLLPSQGGYGAGVDFSASTTVIPIVDLTETAEGSPLRQDLQTSLSYGSITAFSIVGTLDTIINTTGYWRVFGAYSTTDSAVAGEFRLNDGVSFKKIINLVQAGTTTNVPQIVPFDFTVYLGAGDSLQGTTDTSGSYLIGCTRQIADLQGNLVNPS